MGKQKRKAAYRQMNADIGQLASDLKWAVERIEHLENLEKVNEKDNRKLTARVDTQVEINQKLLARVSALEEGSRINLYPPVTGPPPVVTGN